MVLAKLLVRAGGLGVLSDVHQLVSHVQLLLTREHCFAIERYQFNVPDRGRIKIVVFAGIRYLPAQLQFSDFAAA
jgi:hypothetical protein